VKEATNNPAKIKHLSILDFHPTELARQWTLLDQQMLRRIKPYELLRKNFEKAEKSPNVAAINNRFNAGTHWIGTEVVKAKGEKGRAKVITFFIQVGETLFELQNFHGAMAVVAGLGQMPISRLKKSWACVDGKMREKLNMLEDFFSPVGNFSKLREIHIGAVPPMIPTPSTIFPCIYSYFLSLAIYLKDLMFIEDGNDDWLESHQFILAHFLKCFFFFFFRWNAENGMLNMEKITLLGKVVNKIQQSQNLQYKFRGYTAIQDYLSSVSYYSQDELKQASLEVEPPSS